MKKNILTIIIMAIVLINTVLTAVMIFVIVPTSNRTTKLVDKIASIVDLELQDPSADNAQLTVLDKQNVDLTGDLKITLKEGSDGKLHYALIPGITLTLNKKNADYAELSDSVQGYTNKIKEYVTNEIQKYTVDEVSGHLGDIENSVLTQIQDLFNSDFIIDITFGNIVYS